MAHEVTGERCTSQIKVRRHDLNAKFKKRYGNPKDYRVALGQPFNAGREFPWTMECLAPVIDDPEFVSLASQVGVHPSRLEKIARCRDGREIIGTGVLLGIISRPELSLRVCEVPNPTHGAIAGLCRAAPLLKHMMLKKQFGNSVDRDPIAHIKSGFLCFEMLKSEKYDALIAAARHFLVTGPQSTPITETDIHLSLELQRDANHLIHETPRFAQAIGLIGKEEMPIRIAEAVDLLPYWFLSAELLWECVEGSLITTLGIFDPFRLNGHV